MQQFGIGSTSYLPSHDAPRNYTVLTNDEILSRKALLAAGYTGKIPRLHRGRLNDPPLARLYARAESFGWHNLLKATIFPDNLPIPLARLGLSMTLAPLLANLEPEQQAAVLLKMIEAYELMGIDPHEAKASVALPGYERVLDLILERNLVAHLGMLPAPEVALAMVLMLNLRKADLPLAPQAPSPDWRSLAFWSASDNLLWNNLHGMRMLRVYTLAELVQIFSAVGELGGEKMSTLIHLRTVVARAMSVDEVITYLRMPVSLLRDFFPNI